MGLLGFENVLFGDQQNTSPDKSACAEIIIRTGTTLDMLHASYIDAERLGPQSH